MNVVQSRDIPVSDVSAELAAKTLRRHFEDSQGWCAWHRTFLGIHVRWGECLEHLHAREVLKAHREQQARNSVSGERASR